MTQMTKILGCPYALQISLSVLSAPEVKKAPWNDLDSASRLWKNSVFPWKKKNVINTHNKPATVAIARRKAYNISYHYYEWIPPLVSVVTRSCIYNPRGLKQVLLCSFVCSFCFRFVFGSFFFLFEEMKVWRK